MVVALALSGCVAEEASKDGLNITVTLSAVTAVVMLLLGFASSVLALYTNVPERREIALNIALLAGTLLVGMVLMA